VVTPANAALPAPADPAATASAAELAAVLAAVDAGIVVTDRSGRVRSLNEAAIRILDGPIFDLRDLLGPLGQGGAAGPDGVRETTELQVLRLPDRWLEVSRYASDGATVGADDIGEVVIVRDVTTARQVQGLREAFLGMLSHELRTPVTSIYAACGLLSSRLQSATDDGRRDLVMDISAESERLLRLVEDLLILARFDEGIDLVQEPSLLQRVVPAVVERERRRWPEVEIELQIGRGLPVITGDETSVQQVVRNLISNAAKYGLGQPVMVQIAADDGEPGVSVRVLDRGPGVMPAESEALFRPFYRSPRTARGQGGAGIGLYVCRRLVEAMGGRLWARQRPGGGSEFGFWLPEYDYQPDDGASSGAVPAPIIC
jgi:two-component system, OmpR family, sensor histidine kinase KdpD